MNNGQRIHRQLSLPRGLSAWGYLMVLLGISIVITLGLRLGPHYLNHRTVTSVVDSLKTEQVHQMEKRKIREMLTKRFKINSLYDLEPGKIIEIDRSKERTALKINYEVREHVVANADVVLVFNEEYQFR